MYVKLHKILSNIKTGETFKIPYFLLNEKFGVTFQKMRQCVFTGKHHYTVFSSSW